jgi:simple sugar transport system permease protein
MIDHAITLFALTLAAGTVLVFAALGELVTEKAGVLNLGVEGMMLVGAVVSFIVAATTRQPWLGALAGAAAGAVMAAIFGVLTLSLMANQVATGLALSLFGVGLEVIGLSHVGHVVDPIAPLRCRCPAAVVAAVRPQSVRHRRWSFRAGAVWHARRPCPGG